MQKICIYLSKNYYEIIDMINKLKEKIIYIKIELE